MAGVKGNSKNSFPTQSDIIFLYSKNIFYQYFEKQYKPLTEEYIKNFYKFKDENGRIYRKAGGGRPDHYRYYLDESKGTTIDNLWLDLTNIQSSSLENFSFKTQKPEKLLERILLASSKENTLILDFFAGSATTQAVAHKLGRKWIGVEMGEHFYTVDIPRMKTVLWGKISGISKELIKNSPFSKGVPERSEGEVLNTPSATADTPLQEGNSKIGNLTVGGFFKYYDLEQYEDTLRNMKYKDSSPNSIFDTRNPFAQYIFYVNQKFAHVLEVNSPFSKRGVAESDGVFKLPYNPALKEKARELRKAGNLSEVLLWNEIKQNKLGFDFTRQQIIGNYIVDFYCPKLRLVIEIDGSSHDTKQDYDTTREEYLRSLGLHIIHFTDAEVKNNLPGVIEFLSGYIENEILRQTSSGTHLEKGENTPSSLRDITPLGNGNGIPRPASQATPLEKGNLELDFGKLYPNIDFAETISNLLGLPIKRITKASVVLQDGESEREIKTDYKNMKDDEKLEFVRLLKPLLWWGE